MVYDALRGGWLAQHPQMAQAEIGGGSMKAKITQSGVVAESGEVFQFLGSGYRYGFDPNYAVRRKSGDLSALPAYSLPWPWSDNEIEVVLDDASIRKSKSNYHRDAV